MAVKSQTIKMLEEVSKCNTCQFHYSFVDCMLLVAGKPCVYLEKQHIPVKESKGMAYEDKLLAAFIIMAGLFSILAVFAMKG